MISDNINNLSNKSLFFFKSWGNEPRINDCFLQLLIFVSISDNNREHYCYLVKPQLHSVTSNIRHTLSLSDFWFNQVVVQLQWEPLHRVSKHILLLSFSQKFSYSCNACTLKVKSLSIIYANNFCRYWSWSGMKVKINWGNWALKVLRWLIGL